MRHIPLLLLMPLAGCVAVVAGTAAVFGVVKYENNEASRTYEAALKPTFAATVESMRAEGFPVPEGLEPGAKEGEISSGDARVRVIARDEKVTGVLVRIGTFDTEEHRIKSRRILDGVAQRLGVR
ncbi:MAG: DUF3568 family protein [Planctomycetaceae bacterium]